MERLASSLAQYEEHRIEKLMPVIEALIREAIELGYNFRFAAREHGIEREYYVSKKGLEVVFPTHGEDASVASIKDFADFVTKDRTRLNSLYGILLNAQKANQKLTGKYIPEGLK